MPRAVSGKALNLKSGFHLKVYHPGKRMNNSKENYGSARILVVDDSALTLEVIQRNLSAAGYDVYTVISVDQAIDFLEQDSVDLVITDIKMPKISGLELLKYVNENLKGTEIMIITGYPSIKGAVEAVKDGAEDYLVKPRSEERRVGKECRSRWSPYH